ncbi:MAG: hypothetical protein ATN35_00990 [Epulopiscium sp. Nele67-Bin004]|nr:MAG: hypothetical protein ATN35_00990 [Epulopiscium sp. Nele67-Bin004]
MKNKDRIIFWATALVIITIVTRIMSIRQTHIDRAKDISLYNARLAVSEVSISMTEMYTLINALSIQYEMGYELGRIDLEALKQYLALQAENSETVKNMYIGFADGTLIVSDDWKKPEGYNLFERPWYAEALETDGLNISDPYIDESTKQLVVAVSRPLYYSDGELMGVFGTNIYLYNFISLGTNQINSGKYVFLIDEDADIVMHPRLPFMSTEDGMPNLLDIDPAYKEVLDLYPAESTHIETREGYRTLSMYMEVPNTNYKVVSNYLSSTLIYEILEEIWTNAAIVCGVIFIILITLKEAL